MAWALSPASQGMWTHISSSQSLPKGQYTQVVLIRQAVAPSSNFTSCMVAYMHICSACSHANIPVVYHRNWFPCNSVPCRPSGGAGAGPGAGAGAGGYAADRPVGPPRPPVGRQDVRGDDDDDEDGPVGHCMAWHGVA